MVAFNEIGSSLLVPFVGVEFDASAASKSVGPLKFRCLIIGQKLASGSGAANSVHTVTGQAEVDELAGPGSMLSNMFAAWRKNNRSTEVRIGILADDGDGVAATGTFVVTDSDPSVPGADPGTLFVYVGGVRIPVGVNDGDDKDDVATSIAAAINARTDLPVTAGAASGTVTVTYRHKGEVGNGYDLRVNHLAGEKTPVGISVAATSLASGTTNPDLDNLIAAMGDTWYHMIASPYADATSIDALHVEMERRQNANLGIDGVVIFSEDGTYGALQTIGQSKPTGRYLSFHAQDGKKPLTPSADFAAGRCGLIALAAEIDPARPFHTIAQVGAVPVAEADRFTKDERDNLLHAGVSTSVHEPIGVVSVNGTVTMWRQNMAGGPDTAYQQLNTVLTLQFLRYSFVARIKAAFPRCKLADDGTRLRAGEFVVTPSIAKAEAVAWFLEYEGRFLEGREAFEAALEVERSDASPNRLDFLVPPDLMNQFVVGAIKMQFRV